MLQYSMLYPKPVSYTHLSQLGRRWKGIIESIALVTNTIPGMVIGIASVSYTHLDVYKRQPPV